MPVDDEETFPPIFDESWSRRERVLGRFEADLEEGRRPLIEDFLVDAGADASRLLAELVHAELEHRLRLGEPAQAAEYLRRFPGLASDDSAVRELIDAADRHRRGSPTEGPSMSRDGLHPTLASPDRASGSGPTPRSRLGRYELIEAVGRGSFGIVYRAYDPHLQRVVAIKIARSGRPEGPESEARFLREAQSVARLDHPGIVRVYEAGPLDDAFGLVSEFVDGPTLAEVIERDRPGPRISAEWLAQVAEAVAAAHRRGVIHRDLKPANLIVATTGRIRVTDFGLARRADDATLTVDGQPLGTPAYMAPEQARGEGRDVDARADIYSLGTILYQLLVGLVPFRGEAPRLLEQVQFEEPVPPRRLDDRVPRDLETICLKCLEKDPGRRYLDADELARDLRRHLAGEPIRARPVGPLERLVKRARRRPAVSILAVSCSSALIGLAVSLAWQVHRESQHAQALEREVLATRRHLYDVEVGMAFEAWDASRVERARGLLDRQRPDPGEEDLRGFEWFHLWRLCNQDVTLRRHDGPVYDLAFSPDGTILATAGADRTVRLWDTSTWTETGVLLGNGRSVACLAFAPDGRTLYSGGVDGQVRQWDLRTLRLTATLGGDQGEILSMVLSPDGRTMALTSRAGSESPCGAIHLLDTLSGSTLGILAGHQGTVTGLAFSPDGRTLASGSADRTIRLWEVATWQTRAILEGHQEVLLDLAFSPDNALLASSGNDCVIRIWDAATGDVLKVLDDLPPTPTAVAFSSDGRSLAVTLVDEVRVFDTGPFGMQARAQDQRGQVAAVAFSPRSGVMATAGEDGTIRIRDTKTAQVLPAPGARPPSLASIPLESACDAPYCLAFAPGGQAFAVGGGTGFLAIWDSDLRGIRIQLPRVPGIIRGVAFSPDGRTLAVARDGEPIRTYDATTGQEGRPFACPTSLEKSWWSLAYSPDGRTLVAGHGFKGHSGDAVLWEVASGRHLASLSDHSDYVRTAAFSPDGRTLATASGDETVKLWDLATLRVRATLTGHHGEVLDVAFAPDGRTLASGSTDHTVRIWDAADGSVLATLRGHSVTVHSIAFSPDGRRLASGSRIGEIRLWDLITHREVARLVGHTDRVHRMAFSSDGRRLVSCGVDRSLRVWGDPPGP